MDSENVFCDFILYEVKLWTIFLQFYYIAYRLDLWNQNVHITSNLFSMKNTTRVISQRDKYFPSNNSLFEFLQKLSNSFTQFNLGSSQKYTPKPQRFNKPITNTEIYNTAAKNHRTCIQYIISCHDHSKIKDIRQKTRYLVRGYVTSILICKLLEIDCNFYQCALKKMQLLLVWRVTAAYMLNNLIAIQLLISSLLHVVYFKELQLTSEENSSHHILTYIRQCDYM